MHIFRHLDGILPTVPEIKTYEKNLEGRSPLKSWVLPPAQYILTALFGTGNEEAYAGQKGWLFYRPDVAYLTRSKFDIDTPVNTIIDFRNQLQHRKIQLILVPIPGKAQIYPEHFSPRYENPTHPLQNSSYATFIHALEKHDITVVDPTHQMLDLKTHQNVPVFLKTDTHWTPQTVCQVASSLARNIGPCIERFSTTCAFTRHPVSVKNQGDIEHMLQLPDAQNLYDSETVTIRQVNTEGKRWESDPEAPTLLLGDSFTNIYALAGMGWGESAGFAEQLSYHLQMPIDRISINAGGAYATRRALQQDMLRGRDRLAHKQLVIWQFAMRELTEGNWAKIPLPETAAQIPRHARSPARIRAIVKDHTSPPRPGTAPYADCIISLRLTDIEPLEGAPPSDDVIAFAWGMRNNKWTAAAMLKSGDRIVVDLRDWAEVASQYGSYNRKELEDEDAFRLDVFWGTSPGRKNE